MLLRENKIRFDDGAQGFLILLLFTQLFFNNGIYLFVGAFVFGFIIVNLQKPLKPAIFTLIFIYHFIQVSAGIWLSNYLGYDIDYRSPNSGTATIASYVGLVALVAPVIYYNNKLPDLNISGLRKYADRLSIRNVFIAYLIAFFVTNTLSALAFRYSELTQVILSFVNIKWFLFLLFGYLAILKKKMVKIFLLSIVIEFASGFFSYFSEFKAVIFFTACLAMTFVSSIKLKHVIMGVIALAIVAYLGIFWTTIKGQYRAFLNQGSRTQKVQVSQEEALNKLLDLAQQGGAEYKDDPTANFLDRLQYTFHLAKTMDNVPENLPFQAGSNWGETLSYALTPRVLNPDKPKFEATVKTRKYTGLAYAGQKQGVSFSLGYFADGYIDFGLAGMFFPIVIIGFIFGGLYFYFAKHSSHNLLFNYAVAGSMFMEFTAFEMDSTFLVGRLYVTSLTFFALKIFVFPWLIRQFERSPVTVPKKEEAALTHA